MGRRREDCRWIVSHCSRSSDALSAGRCLRCQGLRIVKLDSKAFFELANGKCSEGFRYVVVVAG